MRGRLEEVTENTWEDRPAGALPAGTGYQCAECGFYFPRAMVKDVAGEYYCRTTVGHNAAPTLAGAVRAELRSLWGDLEEALHLTTGTTWSIKCDNLAERIAVLSRFVGPLPWGDVGVDLLLDGVYERVHRSAGIDHPPIDFDRVREVKARTYRG